MKMAGVEIQEPLEWSRCSKTCLLVGSSEKTGYVTILSLRDVRKRVLVLLGVLFTNTFKCCTSSPPNIHLPTSVEPLQATELLALKECEDLHRSLQNRMWFLQNIWLKSRVINLTGTLNRSHSGVECRDAVSVPSGQLPYFTKDKKDTQMVTAEHRGEQQFYK